MASETYDDATMFLAYKYGCCLSMDGRFAEAEALFTLMVENGTKRLGLEHVITVRGMGHLASTYYNQGR
jgi:pentatricopeptide repeat protein